MRGNTVAAYCVFGMTGNHLLCHAFFIFDTCLFILYNK